MLLKLAEKQKGSVTRGRPQVQLPHRLRSISEGTEGTENVSSRSTHKQCMIYRRFLRYQMLRKDKRCHSEWYTVPRYRKLMAFDSRFVTNSTLLSRNKFTAFSKAAE